MNRLIAISVLAGLLGLVMKPMGPYLEYALNQEFIANNYCVNQAKPELKCEGACYLMQRLKAQAESHHDHNVTIEEIGENIEVILPVAFHWPGFFSELSNSVRVKTSLHDRWIAPPIAPPPQLILVTFC